MSNLDLFSCVRDLNFQSRRRIRRSNGRLLLQISQLILKAGHIIRFLSNLLCILTATLYLPLGFLFIRSSLTHILDVLYLLLDLCFRNRIRGSASLLSQKAKLDLIAVS